MKFELYKSILNHPEYRLIEYNIKTEIKNVERHLKGLVSVKRSKNKDSKATVHIESFHSVLGDSFDWTMICIDILKRAAKDIELLDENINHNFNLDDI